MPLGGGDQWHFRRDEGEFVEVAKSARAKPCYGIAIDRRLAAWFGSSVMNAEQMLGATAEDKLRDLVASRRPGFSLEQEFYTSAAVFAADMQYIFLRHWLYAGHVSQAAKAGDFFTYEMGDESLIIIRGRDDCLRAFFNVCTHRGSRICLDRCGHAKSLVCPYHQWVFQTDGKLAAAKYMGDDFDRSGYGLRPAHLREVEGLIFVCLAETPPDFSEVEHDFRAHAKLQRLDKARICKTVTYDVPCNWKLLVENSRECDHCRVGHPELCVIMPPTSPEYVNARMKEFRALGLETRRFLFRSDSWHKVERYPLGPGIISQTLDGTPAAPLMGSLPRLDVGVFTFIIRHSILSQFVGDYGDITQFIPLGPEMTRVQIDWLVNADAVEGRDFDLDRVTAWWKTTMEQDNKLSADNHAGVKSSRYRPGPYSPSEEQAEDFVRWYIREMGLALKERNSSRPMPERTAGQVPVAC